MNILCIAKKVDYLEMIASCCKKERSEVTFSNSLDDLNIFTKNYSLILVEVNENSFDIYLKLRKVVLNNPLSDVLLLMAKCDFESSLKAMRIGIKNILVGNEINKANINEIIKQAIKRDNNVDLQREVNSKYFERLVFYHNKEKFSLNGDYLNNAFGIFNKEKCYCVFVINSLSSELAQLKEDSIGKKAFRERTIERLMNFKNEYGEIVYSFYIDNRFYCVLLLKKNVVGNYDLINLNNLIFNSISEYIKPFLGEDVFLFTSAYRNNFNLIRESINEINILAECAHTHSYPSLISYLTYKPKQITNDMLIITERCVDLFKKISDGIDCSNLLDKVFDPALMSQITFSDFIKAKTYWRFELENLLTEKGTVTNSQELKELLNEFVVPSNCEHTKKTLLSIIKLITETTNKKYNYLISKAIKIISEEYTQNIGLYDVAKKLDISMVYLSQLFKKETNKNFSTFLIEYRIEKAKKLIASGCRIGEVSFQVGFNNSQYFSKCFKKYTNLTPNEYKNSLK